MPDALSKTVPIWCAVFNRALFPEKTRFHKVQFPPNDLLGASEESQIESRIDAFVSLLKDLKLDLGELRLRVGKPMQIHWAWRNYFSPRNKTTTTDNDFHTIVLCSASKRVVGAEMSEGGYIQGAGDDSESWSLGLTPTIFWENKNEIFNTKEEELPELIEDLVQKCRTQNSAGQATLIRPTRNIYISKVQEDADHAASFDLIINCNTNGAGSPEENPKILNLGCGVKKLGSRDLRNALGKVKKFIVSQLGTDPSRSLLVTCETGRDLSAGTILMIICLFYNDNGEFVGLQADSPIDKQFIKQRLVWIITSNHDVNPSRSTLQSVNSFLMQRPD
ncbi:hypothetical protein FQN54_001671 [Arachnomyces sp. PD_36]|nr:hypothetical protein FQN54_001671 [Arachnomyces sp. PD_36]